MASPVLALMLAILSPRPADAPTTLQIKEMDRILAMGDSDTLGWNMGDIGTVLHEQYPKLKIELDSFVSWTAAQMAGYFQRRLDHDKPTLVIFSLGVSGQVRFLQRLSALGSRHPGVGRISVELSGCADCGAPGEMPHEYTFLP